MSQPENIILTGVPRSGTSLACRLLSQIDNVLALQESMDVGTFSKLGGFLEIKKMIDAFFAEMRISAIERGEVISRHVDGKLPDNYFPNPGSTNGLRKGIKTRGYMPIGKKVNSDMTMILKHPAAFTALIPELRNHYPVFAILRNPLWALASWNSTEINVGNGHAPMAENLDAKLAADLMKIEDKIDRQIFLLSWMFERYSMLESKQRIYYEDIIDNPGEALSVITPKAKTLQDELKASNHPARYPTVPLDVLRERLLKSGGVFFDYYSRDDIQVLGE